MSIEKGLEGHLPAAAIEQLDIRFGHAARVLHEAAQELQADLIVLYSLFGVDTCTQQRTQR